MLQLQVNANKGTKSLIKIKDNPAVWHKWCQYTHQVGYICQTGCWQHIPLQRNRKQIWYDCYSL